MKRNRIFKLMVCALLFLVTGVQAQSLKDILNSSAVRDAVTAVTGGKQFVCREFGGNMDVRQSGDSAGGGQCVEECGGQCGCVGD